MKNTAANIMAANVNRGAGNSVSVGVSETGAFAPVVMHYVY